MLIFHKRCCLPKLQVMAAAAVVLIIAMMKTMLLIFITIIITILIIIMPTMPMMATLTMPSCTCAGDVGCTRVFLSEVAAVRVNVCY